MPSLKTDGKAGKRTAMNTTIRTDVFDDFRRKCKEYGIPMNVLLETFMRQFAAGEFYLKLGRDESKVDFVDDVE